MKQHHSIFPPAASLACALILMLAACTSDALDELPPAGTDPDAHPLTITVSDGGMYATGQPAPRNAVTAPSSPKATASASTW